MSAALAVCVWEEMCGIVVGDVGGLCGSDIFIVILAFQKWILRSFIAVVLKVSCNCSDESQRT